MKRIKVLVIAILLSVGMSVIHGPQPVAAHDATDAAFDNVFYSAFYDGLLSNGYDTITSDCMAAVLTSGTKWHGQAGYAPPADHYAGDTWWEILQEDHPFLRAVISLACSTEQLEDRFGTSVNGHIRIDVASVCKSNSVGVECDITERQRLTFVAAREMGIAYCYMQTGSNTCGYEAMAAECIADYYARHLMEVPWASGDAYSYYNPCVVYGGMPA